MNLSTLDFRSCNSKIVIALLSLIFLYASSVHGQSTINHWETVVYDSSMWKYFPGTTDPGSAWNSLGYDDISWDSGKGGIGYGDSDDRTKIDPVLSVFIRRKFNVVDLNKIEQAMLHVDFDDGFIAYINGVEVARAAMGTDEIVPYNQPAARQHEALLYQGFRPESFLISKSKLASILNQGENVLALQVHNENEGSSDISAAAFLSFAINDNSNNYGPLPTWFVLSTVLDASTLPIFIINTNGETIMDDTRVVADMSVVYNGEGNINTTTETPNHYVGKISIETRGESSQQFPKKSYGLETQDALGNNLNVSLVDLPEENDWILYAPYSDKTMLRNALTYKIGNDLGHYASRTRFVEVILNYEYQGVYVLMEKIKRDKNRVDMATLKPEDVSGDEVTGGYIIRRDKIDATDYPAWRTDNSPWGLKFQYFDPKGDELVEEQRQYIRTFINHVEVSLAEETFKDEEIGYRKYIDVPSAIDFMLVNEIAKNVDAYTFSNYMYKDKESRGGKLHMGPLWDFNYAYGNVNYYENSQIAPGWIWTDRMYWYQRMVQDPYFASTMKCRWLSLRQTTLSNEYFSDTIDEMVETLGDAQVRNFERWPILGVWITPNQYVGATYADEVNWLKQWLFERLAWMDANMPGDCELITATENEPLDEQIAIYPNPSAKSFNIALNQSAGKNIKIEIYSMMGEQVLSAETSNPEFVWEGSHAPGVYVVRISSENKILATKRITKL